MGELASQQCRVGGEGVEWMKGRESEREKLGWKVGRDGEVGGGRSRSHGRARADADGRADNQRGRKNALRREREASKSREDRRAGDASTRPKAVVVGRPRRRAGEGRRQVRTGYRK